MAGKNDAGKVFDKYGPMWKKFSTEVGEVAKKGEESVISISKLLKIQLDMLGVALQKEKLYYDLGKDVAAKLADGRLNIEGLECYKKQFAKIQTEGEKNKKAMSRVKVKSPKRTKSSNG